jgi:hypothetical protein
MALSGVLDPRSSAQQDRWTFPTVLEPRADAHLGPSGPRIVRDRAGQLHAVWAWAADGGAESALAYARRPAGGAWGLPEAVAPADGVPRAAPDLAVASDGAVHVVWSEARSGSTYVAHRIRRRADGSWSVAGYVDPVRAPVAQA